VIRECLTVDGRAILSGILEEEREMMTDAIMRHRMTIESEDLEEGWWSVLVARQQ